MMVSGLLVYERLIRPPLAKALKTLTTMTEADEGTSFSSPQKWRTRRRSLQHRFKKILARWQQIKPPPEAEHFHQMVQEALEKTLKALPAMKSEADRPRGLFAAATDEWLRLKGSVE